MLQYVNAIVRKIHGITKNFKNQMKSRITLFVSYYMQFNK